MLAGPGAPGPLTEVKLIDPTVTGQLLQLQVIELQSGLGLAAQASSLHVHPPAAGPRTNTFVDVNRRP